MLFPLLAFVINFLFPKHQFKWAGLVATSTIFLSLIFSAIIFSRVWESGHIQHQRMVWFTIGNTIVYAGLLLNNLSVLMLLLVNLIALPVHIYSTAYMKGDENYNRYFAYLSFFCFSMLALVVVDNLVLFYGFWELVGFSSYLLIGFWYKKERAVKANKKAFIMNRIGDIGLLTAIIIIFTQFHTFDIEQLFSAKGLVVETILKNGLWGALPASYQYLACAGLFMAVFAKSAQFPLHTWLPDAMEGPTAVSALIHAATMVAAGVFLLGRVYPFFTTSELDILAIIGCFTAFMAATIALTQNDLKRILAYSTISQLGYMVMAMGVGAYSQSLFHLVTHAFFKCMLFLVAGIVIHHLHHLKEEQQLDTDPQNIQNMGGLSKQMPLVFLVAIIGGLALIGFPFTSGFLSKDSILIQTASWSLAKGGAFYLVPFVSVITTLLTAFYVTRLIVKVFLGKSKLGIDMANQHPAKINLAYSVPLVFLAACSLFLVYSLNPFSYLNSWVIKGFSLYPAGEGNIWLPIVISLLSTLFVVLAYFIYIKPNKNIFPQYGFFYKLSYHEWYFDVNYQKLIVTPILLLANGLFWFDSVIIDGFVNLLAKITITLSKVAAWTDRYIVDGFLNFIVALAEAIANFARKFQGGKVQYYLFSMLVILLVLFILQTVF